MTYKFDGSHYIVRLDPDERLAAAMDAFFDETGLKGGWINGIGAAYDIELGFFDTAHKAHEWQTFAEPHEIISLQGPIARSTAGKLAFHLHGSFSDKNYQIRAGHVKDFVTLVTLELFVSPTRQPLVRRLGHKFGIEQLDV